jgi:CRISPR-associated protein Cmr4
MSNSFNAYFIQCITNMHVGSGDANYGVVDKLVQRDTITQHPTIHPSSLKGALREHFENEWIYPLFDFSKINKPFKKVLEQISKEKTKKQEQQNFEFLDTFLKDKTQKAKALEEIRNIERIFGKEALDNDSQTGDFKFLGADLVALPVRCNFQQFVLGVNQTQLQLLNQKAKLLTDNLLFKNTKKDNTFFYQANQPGNQLFAEDTEITSKLAFEPIVALPTELIALNSKYASFNDGLYTGISNDLPVIARNTIEDGTSQNLWYEQVVPHQSIFLTFIAGSGTLLDKFESTLKSTVVQIGGNATIGYGLCKFYKISL